MLVIEALPCDRLRHTARADDGVSSEEIAGSLDRRDVTRPSLLIDCLRLYLGTRCRNRSYVGLLFSDDVIKQFSHRLPYLTWFQCGLVRSMRKQSRAP